MSRRTKLIALAIFVVLLGISIGHLILTWRPHEPLRIRLVREHEQFEVRERLAYRVFEVEIENISSVPIHVSRVGIHREDGPHRPFDAVGEVELKSTGDHPTTDTDGNPIIPAHGRWRGRALTRHISSGDFTDGNTFFIASWTSRTRYRVMEFYLSLVQCLPKSWQERLPSPEFEEDLFALDSSPS